MQRFDIIEFKLRKILPPITLSWLKDSDKESKLFGKDLIRRIGQMKQFIHVKFIFMDGPGFEKDALTDIEIIFLFYDFRHVPFSVVSLSHSLHSCLH